MAMLEYVDKVLIDQRELAANTLQSMGDGVICTDLGGYITYLNGAAEVMTGWSCRAATGHRLAEVIGLDDETTVEATVSPILRQNGTPAGTVTVLRNVGATIETLRQMAHLAHHDVLTGLPNRVLLRDRTRAAIALAQRHGKPLAVGFLDVDGFKSVNDSLGHAAGDELLRSIAARLLGALRQSDSVGRYGGDEFVILLSEIEHAEDCMQVRAKLMHAIALPIRVGMQEVTVGASLGMAIYPDHGQTADALIAYAVAALYDTKRAGVRGCRVFDCRTFEETTSGSSASLRR